MIQKILVTFLVTVLISDLGSLKPLQADFCQYVKQNETGNQEMIQNYGQCMQKSLSNLTEIKDVMYDVAVPTLLCISNQYPRCSTYILPMPGKDTVKEIDPPVADSGGRVDCPKGKPWTFRFRVYCDQMYIC